MEYKHKLQRAREKLRLVREKPQRAREKRRLAQKKLWFVRAEPQCSPRMAPNEWRFSCISQRLAGFNAFRRPNRVNNARFSAIHFKMSDLPPLVTCIQTDARPR